MYYVDPIILSEDPNSNSNTGGIAALVRKTLQPLEIKYSPDRLFITIEYNNIAITCAYIPP